MEVPAPDLQSLARRVTRLETQNRRLRQAGIAALVLASAAVVMGQAQASRVLEANAFHLKDASGRVRARMSMDAAGRPTLSILDQKGFPVAILAGGDAPFLVLNRAGTKEMVQLGANPTFYGLGLYEKEIRAGLSVQSGSSGLDLYDEKGKALVSIGTAASGSHILMTDHDGKATATMWTEPYVGSGLSISGSAGTLRVNLEETLGGPSLQIEDKEGYSSALGRTDLVVTTTGRKERTPAASLVLFGKDKKVLWSAPQ